MSQAVLDRLRVLQEFSRSGGGGELLARSLDKIISLERERLTAKSMTLPTTISLGGRVLGFWYGQTRLVSLWSI